MNILVLGASGLLGSNVATTATRRNNSVIGTYRSNDPNLDIPCHRCDLTKDGSVAALLNEHDPNTVVNCAALTDVDMCERDPSIAQTVNADAPGRIAELCHDRGIKFVHVSTDYVFDGVEQTPYTENCEPDPLQVYGRTKLAGERKVLEAFPESLIVRLSFIYGTHRSTGDLSGFPAWVASELHAGNEVPLFTDQHVTPSRAAQVAMTILDLVAAHESGVFHVACQNCVTPYDFGLELASRIDATGRVLKGSREDVDRAAPRPAYTCLDTSKVETVLNRPQPTLQEDLENLMTL